MRTTLITALALIFLGGISSRAQGSGVLHGPNGGITAWSRDSSGCIINAPTGAIST